MRRTFLSLVEMYNDSAIQIAKFYSKFTVINT